MGGQEGHLYMLSEEGRHLLVEQVKQEKTPIAQEERKTKSLEVTKSSSTTFQWPQNAAVLESASPSNSISSALEDKLKDLGIFRAGGEELSNSEQVEGAARRCGLELTKKQVRVSFDTFMAKSRPGLESDEEVKESSPKPKKRQNNNNNNNNKKMTEPVLRHERREGKEKKTT